MCSQPSTDEFEALVQAYLEDGLSPAEARRLHELLKERPSLGDHVIGHLKVDGMLRDVLTEVAAVRVTARGEDSPTRPARRARRRSGRRSGRRPPVAAMVISLAAAVLLALVGLQLLPSAPERGPSGGGLATGEGVGHAPRQERQPTPRPDPQPEAVPLPEPPPEAVPMPEPARTPPAVARIVDVWGHARIRRESEPARILVERGTELMPGDELATANDGDRARLGLGDDCLIDLSEATIVRLGTDASRIALQQGDVFVQLQKQAPGDPLVVATAHAEVTVTGTAFRLSCREGQTRLEVEEGEVRVNRPGEAKSVAVSAGQSSLASPGVPLETKPFFEVLWSDGFDDLHPWQKFSYEPKSRIDFSPDLRNVRSGRQSLRLRYIYPGAPVNEFGSIWWPNYRQACRHARIPRGVTHLRLWIHSVSASEDTQLYVQLASTGHEKTTWSYAVHVDKLPDGWNLLEFDLRTPMGRSGGPGVEWRPGLPPVEIEKVTQLHIGANFADLDVSLDSLEFVKK